MIYIGSDHGGFDLKLEIIDFIKNNLNREVTDLGCFDKESVDYPDIARIVATKVKEENTIGILICGTGIGISIAANKIEGIRCALCSDEYSARMTRKHNDSNILALGGRTIGPEVAKAIVENYLASDFEGGRHQRRVDKIADLDKNRS